MKKEQISNRISDSLGIPRDIIADMGKIIITGNGAVHIEGFSGIDEYSEERISIRVKNGMFIIEGKSLSIDEITEEYINLKGMVKSVEFV